MTIKKRNAKAKSSLIAATILLGLFPSIVNIDIARAASAITVANTTFGSGVATNVGVSLSGFDETQNYQVTVKFVNNVTNVDVTNGTLAATQGSTSLIAGYTSYSAAKLGFSGSYAQVAAALSSMTWNPNAASGDISIRIGIASKPGANEFYDANSGHYYKYIASSLTWTAAQTAAESLSLFGLRGYLAEIDSLSENGFIDSETSASNIWIGATEDATTAANPGGHTGNSFSGAAGQKWIWQGALITPLPSGSGGGAGNTGNTANGYSNWAGDEPNNDSKPGPDCGVILSRGAGWNDLKCSSTNPYLVEFGGRAEETSTAVTNTLTTTVKAVGAVTLGTFNSNVSCTVAVNCSFPISLSQPTAKNSSNVDVPGAFTYASSDTNKTEVRSVLVGGTVELVSPGTSTITVTFTPTSNLYATVTKSFTIAVTGQSQSSLTITSTTGLQSGLNLTTSGGSGTIAVTYAVSNGTATGCAITSGTLTSSTAGTCLITATNPANGNYASVSSSQTAITLLALTSYSVTSATSAPSSASVTTGYSTGTSATVTLTRAGNSGSNPSNTLSVTAGTWTVTAGAGASVSSGTVTSSAPVTITLTASSGTYTLSLNTGAVAGTYTASDTATTPLSYSVVVSNNCLAGQVCASGNIGPGGGLVFYASDTPFYCGPTRAQLCQGLEIAPRDWSGSTPSPLLPWALPAKQAELIPLTGTDFGDNLNLAGDDLGWGLIDNWAIFQQHGGVSTGYAAGVAKSYNGGGQTDWSLPSRGEANKLGLTSALSLINSNSTYALSGSDPAITYDCVGAYASDCLWTSWQGAANAATNLRLLDNDAGGYKGKESLFYVRPIRAILISEPTVSGVSPTSGLGSGGEPITVTGTNFSSRATVTVGGSACTSVSVDSSTTITCLTPARGAGAKDVLVTNSDTGSAVKVSGFTYKAAVNYTVSSATSSPSSASVTTGYSTGTSTTVTLTRAGNSGSNPTSTVSVTGGTWTITAGAGVSVSSGTITSIAPVNITLTAASGTYTLTLNTGEVAGTYTASDSSTTPLSYVVTVTANAAPAPRPEPQLEKVLEPTLEANLSAIAPILDKQADPYVTVNGEKITAVVQASSSGSEVKVITPSWTLSLSVEQPGVTAIQPDLTAAQPGGQAVPISSKLVLLLKEDKNVVTSGNGFKPNSEVRVYIFSTPRLIGTTTTDSNGNFMGNFPMLKDIALGDHFIQVNGLSPDNQVRSTTLPAIYEKAKAVVTPVVKNLVFVVPFASNKYTLNASQMAILKSVKQVKSAKIQVIGYAQPFAAQADIALSLDRALEVKKAVSKIVPKANFITRGSGPKKQPLCAAYKNKCVVVTIIQG